MWHSSPGLTVIRGLQVGFSAYHDVLTPGVPVRIGETILAAHAVFIRPNFEC